ncbi:MAG TPA: ankyrin repeat domain-containing protein [Candidatus Babeliales bacterium]|nr:ankyrin repeat domain-containing protein [Candidatus Babeliales bacterium]
MFYSANPNIQNEFGDTPLHCAVILNFIVMVKILLDDPRTDPNIKDNYGYYTRLDMDKENITIVQSIINDKRADSNIQDNGGNTPLHIAIYKKKIEIVKILLDDSRTDPNIQDEYGNTPLHIAIDRNNRKIVKMLLSNSRTDPNIQDKDRNAPLHKAIDRNNRKIVKILLSNSRTDPNIQNRNGDTPIMLAAQKAIDIVNALLLGGANILDINNNKETILYIAYSHKIIQDINKLNHKENDHNKRAAFLNNELHQISTITNNDKSTYNKVNDFISWCIGNGAEINTRNTNKLRPVDVAESLYNYVLKHSINKDITHKERIYHIFLDHTPYCSDAIVYSLLRRTVDDYDVIKIIMGYYKALTIDREIALRINSNLNFYSYSMQKIEKEQFRDNLLNDICQQKGYHNPYKALPIM